MQLDQILSYLEQIYYFCVNTLSRSPVIILKNWLPKRNLPFPENVRYLYATLRFIHSFLSWIFVPAFLNLLPAFSPLIHRFSILLIFLIPIQPFNHNSAVSSFLSFNNLSYFISFLMSSFHSCCII